MPAFEDIREWFFSFLYNLFTADGNSI